ncbi:MAG TPA: tetratricopeptide repeat protein [Acidimicrobiia bacterium]
MPSPDLETLLGELEASPDDPKLNHLVACAYDSEGLEREAVPHYLRAIDGGLDEEDLRSAYLGLGSTYRALGSYEEALATFDRGLEVFPGAPEMRAFRAMALHNLGRSEEAVSELLKVLAEHAEDEHVQGYRRAIEFYADRLSETW